MKSHYRKSTRGIVMHHLGKSKVTKLNAKAGVVYPLIRLPKGYADEIGKVAEIFETSTMTDGHFLSLSTTRQRMQSLKLRNQIQKLYNFCLKLYNRIAQMASNLAYLLLNSRSANLNKLFFQKKSLSSIKRENRRPRARFEPASWPPQGHRITMLPHLGTASKGV